MRTRREFLHIDPSGAAVAAPAVLPGQAWYTRMVEKWNGMKLVPRRSKQRNAVAPVPAPVEIVTPAVEIMTAEADEIAAVLSPSQVRTFTECQVRWFYKHVLHYPERRSSALGLGSAFHDATGENWREKITTKQDLDAETVEGLFRASWSHQLESVELTDDEDADDLEDMGAAMVGAYMANVAPLVQPVAVELDVEGEIGGVKVRGKIDVLDANGTVVDAKTASKKPAGVDPNYRFQVATYVQLCPQASGAARIDTVTKTKTIQCHQSTVQIGDSDKLQTAKMYPLVQEAMRSGLYVPNRNSNLCSKKHCSFWSQCVEDYGGHVDER